MAVGLGQLGLAPTEFWGMTPREFVAAINGRMGSSRGLNPMERSELADLMGQFPDH
ncbi:MAG: hypothetical protein CTY20_02200 [Hyphomicrobium sp.]|nr:MAG: hypothetical protein CTY20_02200 [Hyphomicrobium sp.]